MMMFIVPYNLDELRLPYQNNDIMMMRIDQESIK
jgi:hypothetical protein